MSAPANFNPAVGGESGTHDSKDAANVSHSSDDDLLSNIDEQPSSGDDTDSDAAAAAVSTSSPLSRTQRKNALRRRKKRKGAREQAQAQEVTTKEDSTAGIVGCTVCCQVHRSCLQFSLGENQYSPNRCPHCWCSELVYKKDEPTLQAIAGAQHPSAQQKAAVHARLKQLRQVKFPTTEEPGCKLSYIALGDVRKFRPKSLAACVYCYAVFKASEIVDVIPEFDGSLTAQCPKCSIDAVIEVRTPNDLTVEWYKTMAQHRQDGFGDA